jgi:hypothetical protein
MADREKRKLHAPFLLRYGGEGDPHQWIEIHVADSRELAIARKPGREELLKRLRAFRGRLPADFKFDRDQANVR